MDAALEAAASVISGEGKASGAECLYEAHDPLPRAKCHT